MITFDQVSYSYKETKENSLQDISLHIPKGQCVLLCGLSGCGKTTLTRLINGLIPHFFEGTLTGESRVSGIPAKEADIARLSLMAGTVFQNPRTQFFNTDTDSEIVFGLENRGLPRAELQNRLEEVCQTLQIENLRNRNIFNLSGGEKQKIAFASVYASDPEIFVLDEPSSNLDYPSIQALKLLIQTIKEQKKTIVIAEHRIWYLMDVADRVLYMEKGRILRDMGIEEFKTLPKNRLEEMGLRCRDLAEVKGSKTAAAAGPPLLAVKDLTVKLGKTVILENISFEAREGEILALAGENGTGKTTLARTLCGLVKEEAGSIFYEGKPLSGKKRRENSYMVMQDVGHQLFTHSVYAECELGIKPEAKPRIEETLQLLSLSDLKARHPLSLSGGQKQRLAAGVSMLCGKKILLFDEPTSGLDLKSMKEVGELLWRLREEKKILMVITHDMEFIKRICSRVLILSHGKIRRVLSGKEKDSLEQYLTEGEIP